MKIKSFTQFLNEFEIESDVQEKVPKISPFTKEDIEKVEDIILKWQIDTFFEQYPEIKY